MSAPTPCRTSPGRSSIGEVHEPSAPPVGPPPCARASSRTPASGGSARTTAFRGSEVASTNRLYSPVSGGQKRRLASWAEATADATSAPLRSRIHEAPDGCQSMTRAGCRREGKRPRPLDHRTHRILEHHSSPHFLPVPGVRWGAPLLPERKVRARHEPPRPDASSCPENLRPAGRDHKQRPT